MKKDTSNQSIIDLDLHFKNLEPSKIVTEARDYSKPLVTIPEEVSIDFDAILLEWSYRCDKGYPDMNDRSDMLHLQAILEEKGIESPFEKLTEAKLGTAGKSIMAKLADPKLNIRPEALTQIQKVLETFSDSDQKILLSKFQSYTLDQFIKGGYKVFTKFFDAKSSQGMGRGEMMCVMGIKDSRSGGTAEKDLVINSGPKKGVWEVKEDPTGIRMAQAGFSGRFGYIQKMTEFYNMLKVIELDKGNDVELLENLKKVFTDESIAAEMLAILTTNFRGDGYGQSKKDKEEGATITKANFFDRMIVAAEFPTGVIDLHYAGFRKLSALKKDILKNSDLVNNAKLLVKTPEKDSEYFINKDDAKDIENAKSGDEVRIKVAAPAKKDFKVFLYNILNIVKFDFVKDPDLIPQDFVDRKRAYFSDIEGYVYFLKNNSTPYLGDQSNFVIYGISQGMGKMESIEIAAGGKSAFLKRQVELS
jgi:hypothetical protein